jgi:hypothetical protein
VTGGEGLKKNCHIATWVGEKIRFGSEMTCATCCTISSKRWRGTLEVSMSVHQRRFEPSALQRRGSAVDSRSGRFRQWGPLPLAPRPCACPVRASAPSRRRATSAPAYHSSYLRNWHSFNNRSYPHLLSAGSPGGDAGREAGGGPCRQAPPVAGASAPPCTSPWYWELQIALLPGVIAAL